MQFSTTPTLEGQPIIEYCGVVTGEAILGANVFRDFFASIRDIVGGRSGAYEKEPASGRKTLLLRKMLHDIRKKHPDQEITVTTSHPNEVALFQTKGFTVFRQTKNYYFLKRECSV